MSARMELLKEYYNSTSKGGIGTPEEFWTDDFVWDVPRPRDMPGAGKYEGKASAISALRAATEGWDKCSVSADEIFEDEDRIVVMGHIDIEHEGKSVTTPVVHIWGFRPEEKQTSVLVSACFYHNLKGMHPRTAA